jgi:6-phospho-beta-glucosidase
VPLVYRALLAARAGGPGGSPTESPIESPIESPVGSPIGEVALYDADGARVAAIGRVLDGLAARHPAPPRVVVAPDLGAALEGAAYVFCAVRVGGLAGRIADERVALDLGLLGQETVGPGGVAYALRSVPVLRRIAEVIAEVAPQAWTINFTNPVGVVTEAMSGVLCNRVVGICDSPVGLFRRVAWLLGEPVERVWFDYSGLNHLGWLSGAYVRGVDRLPELLDSPEALARTEEGRLFGPARLRELGALPNEYLHYYYDTADAIAAVAGATRGEFLAGQQDAFYAAAAGAAPAAAAAEWARVRAERDATYLPEAQRAAAGADEPSGGGYEDVALAVMRALAGGPPASLVLNTALRHTTRAGRLPAGPAGVGAVVDGAAVVEVPCLVDGTGVHPLVTGPLPAHAVRLVAAIKNVDRLILAAADTGDRSAALRAFEEHPLVGSADLAVRLLGGYAAAHPELAHFRGPSPNRLL